MVGVMLRWIVLVCLESMSDSRRVIGPAYTMLAMRGAGAATPVDTKKCTKNVCAVAHTPFPTPSGADQRV